MQQGTVRLRENPKEQEGNMSTIYKAFLAWLACTEIMMSQPSSTIVVVTTNTTPPAFLQELRADDPKTLQRVAEREGFEAFQKEDAWYLIPRTLLKPESDCARQPNPQPSAGASFG